MGQDRLPKKTMRWIPGEHRKKGRPKKEQRHRRFVPELIISYYCKLHAYSLSQWQVTPARGWINNLIFHYSQWFFLLQYVFKTVNRPTQWGVINMLRKDSCPNSITQVHQTVSALLCIGYVFYGQILFSCANGNCNSPQHPWRYLNKHTRGVIVQQFTCKCKLDNCLFLARNDLYEPYSVWQTQVSRVALHTLKSILNAQ